MATFADFLATGSGKTAYRAVIEGCSTIFVTDPAMECTMDDGRVVVRGLLREGLSIEEAVYIAGAELDLKLSSLQIAETDGPNLDAATRAFSGMYNASVQTYLADDAAAADTTLSVRGAAALTVADVLHFGTEAFRVTAIHPSGTTAADTIDVERGLWRTTPQAFAIEAPGSGHITTNVVEITDAPQNYAGRRVWLYGHGASELALDPADDTADGTLIWRGILATNPELTDSRTWTLSMQSRMSLLDVTIGNANDGGTKLRGIYYSAACPLYLGFDIRSGSTPTSSWSATAWIYFYGFYETQEEFCDALTAAIAAEPTLAAAGGTWTVRPTSESWVHSGMTSGTWDLYYSPNFGSPKWVSVQGGSPVDGSFDWTLISRSVTGSGRTTWTAVTDCSGLIDLRVGWIAGPASAVVYPGVSVPVANARKVPRGSYQEWIGTGVGTGVPDSAHTTWPKKRFYLDFAAALASWGTVKITPPALDSTSSAPEPIDAAIGVYSAAGYIEITDTAIELPPFGAAGDFGPTFELTTAYGPITSLTGCSLAEFMQAIITASPQTGNLGGPFITSDDVADWTDVVAAATSGITALQRRIYSFSKPRKLLEILREEWKLHGLYPVLDSAGKIAVRPIPAAGSGPTTLAIDASNHAPDDDFGKLRPSAQGIVTAVEIQSGYVPADDDWLTTWTFDALGGKAAAKGKGQTLTITPYSRAYAPAAPGTDLTVDEARQRVQKILALFGGLYYYVDVPVTMLLHGARLGDEVLVTIRQLPYAGARASNTAGAGLTNVRAFVVRRSFMYDDAGGELTLLVQGRNTAGYAPSAWVESATGGPTSYALTVTATRYSDTTDASFFAAGMRVVLRQWDVEAPSAASGSITGVVGNVITVQFGSIGFSPVGCVLGFDGAPNGITVAQQAFCYMADPTGRITYASGGTPSRTFA